MTLAEEDDAYAWKKHIFVKTNVQIKGCDLCSTSHGEQVVIPLSTDGVIHPTTERVVKYMNTTVVLEPTVSEGRLILAHIILKRFASSLFWVLYYQTNAIRKKDLYQLDIKGYESFGKLYSAELNLCFACLDFWDSNDLSGVSDQNSALDWWSQLIEEDIYHHLNSPWEKGSKEDEEKAIQYILDCLHSWDNPYLPEEYPDHFNLIESAIAIAKHCPTDNNRLRRSRREFREGAWKQYKEALHGVKRALHTSPELKRLHLYNNNLYAQIERQKRVRIIPQYVPICLQDFLPQIGG